MREADQYKGWDDMEPINREGRRQINHEPDPRYEKDTRVIFSR